MNTLSIGNAAHGRQHSFCLSGLAIVACFVISVPAEATSVCRWIDENGQVQFADVVPDRYKGIVTCTHSLTPDVNGKGRAVIEGAKNRDSKASAPQPAASNAAAPPVASPLPAAKRPAETVTESTDCKTWWRLFDESGACFAPFRTTRGGVKAEAFDRCNAIPSPQEKCGPQSN